MTYLSYLSCREYYIIFMNSSRELSFYGGSSSMGLLSHRMCLDFFDNHDAHDSRGAAHENENSFQRVRYQGMTC